MAQARTRRAGKRRHVYGGLPPNSLDENWKRLIRTHVFEREHPRVLTGSPLTDVHVRLIAGRAHLKHTEGGDFREATLPRDPQCADAGGKRAA